MTCWTYLSFVLLKYKTYNDYILVSPLRICIIASYPPVRGGEATYTKDFVHALATYFPEEIGEIHVLTHSESAPLKKYEQDGKIKVIRLFDSCKLSRNFAFLKILYKILHIRPNIVHLQYSTIPNGRYGGILGESLFVLCFLFKIFRVPFYITQHSIWLPHEAEERIYEKTRSKLLSVISRRYLRFFTHYFGILPTKLFLLVNVKNSHVTEEFRQAFNIPTHKIKEELHGVWTDWDEMEIQQQRNSRKIVCLGVLNPSKGYEFTIMAMSQVLEKFPDALLVIAGSPPPTNFAEGKNYIDRLRYIIKKYGLENSAIIDDRYLSDREFIEYIKTAGMVVLPYSKVVGASGIMHLAMKYGIPLIVAGSGLLFEEISNIVPVVPPRNIHALAETIICILSRDNNMVLIGKYKQYLKNHDWQIVSKSIYEEYIKGQRRQ